MFWMQSYANSCVCDGLYTCLFLDTLLGVEMCTAFRKMFILDNTNPALEYEWRKYRAIQFLVMTQLAADHFKRE